MRKFTLALVFLTPLWLTAPAAQAQVQLITNGGFETGDFTGWATPTQGNGGFQIGGALNDGMGDYLTPGTQSYSVGPASGNYYAVSDASDPVNGGPGARALLQTFTVPAGATNILLNFDMFVNDYNGAGALDVGGRLDPNIPSPIQYARVDILTGTAAPFATDSGSVLDNLYAGEDPGNPPNLYTHYTYDLTTLLQGGGTFQLRFAEVDNQFVINQGVDNVSLTAVTPEPGSLALLAGLVLTSGLWKARRRKQTARI